MAGGSRTHHSPQHPAVYAMRTITAACGKSVKTFLIWGGRNRWPRSWLAPTGRFKRPKRAERPVLGKKHSTRSGKATVRSSRQGMSSLRRGPTRKPLATSRKPSHGDCWTGWARTKKTCCASRQTSPSRSITTKRSRTSEWSGSAKKFRDAYGPQQARNRS